MSFVVDKLDTYWSGADIRMQDETARVEDALLDKVATAAIMNCFVQSSGSHLEKVIDRYGHLSLPVIQADRQLVESPATISLASYSNFTTTPSRTSLYLPLSPSQSRDQTQRSTTDKDPL